jgi:hypothetical protein
MLRFCTYKWKIVYVLARQTIRARLKLVERIKHYLISSVKNGAYCILSYFREMPNIQNYVYNTKILQNKLMNNCWLTFCMQHNPSKLLKI